ncbi:MAG: TAXI family TRAP transporter solute-binding subunit [Alphaproteobacteria bacterium]|nr:TAXI family TRAP transporter solute-binding subunit [Alphaproteobacteria bacterium]
MKNLGKKIAIALTSTALLTSSVMAAGVVGIASGQPGSLGHNTGQAVAKIANQEAGIVARTQPLSGTAAYLPLINNGEIEFGFANSVETEFAFSGKGNFDGRANPNLRVVGVMFPLRTGLMVAADSGIKTIADLKANAKGMRIASEYTSSTIIPYYIMGALANGDMSYDDFEKIPVSNFVKGIFALGDGHVDLTLISLNSGAGKKVNAQLQGRGGIKYVSLDLSDDAVARFKKLMPSGNLISIKANENIPGMSEDANLVEIPWLLLTNKDVSDELVYNMTKVIAENKEKLGASFGAFKRANLAKMAPSTIVEYHPGALKYYAEKGIVVGE